MLDWVKENAMFIATICGGTAISVLTSEKHSLPIAGARVLSGLFCAMVFTDPVLDLMSLDPDGYRPAIGGILAMSGYNLAQFIVRLDKEKLVSIIKAVRGR